MTNIDNNLAQFIFQIIKKLSDKIVKNNYIQRIAKKVI